ncbi:MAG: zf-TFIIB domain-containing protein [Actinomycetota bacterium]|jgi:uncharacterized protein
MNCPSDGTLLQLAERHRIEIDYCPTCRGVWLDRGELDKIVARADDNPGPRGDRRTGQRGGWDDDDDDYDDAGTTVGGRKRKRGGLRDLFDF